MAKYATVSADIVSSTSLVESDLSRLTTGLKDLLLRIESRFPDCWGRLVKGDSIECVTSCPNDILRIALLLRTYVKSFEPMVAADADFSKIGLRIAIGIGDMRIVSKEKDMLDGEAIYLSGRAMANKRDSLQILSNNQEVALEVILSLVDAILRDASHNQSMVLHNMLWLGNQKQVAEVMNIKQSTVSVNLKRVHYEQLEKALKFFENKPF